jgi:hypothetical protein
MPEEEQNFIALSKKATRWLFAMSKQSIASGRAWQLCDLSLRKLAQGMKYDVSDMPSYPYPSEDITVAGVGPQVTGLSGPNSVQDYWGPQLEHLPNPDSQETPGQDHYYPNMSSADLLSSLAAETQDSYFPYDPISGEFMRSFFPHASENDWTQN